MCRTPACGGDADCPNECCNGQFCGNCPSVANCAVIPEAATLVAGGTAKFSLVAYDSAGNPLAPRGAVTWAASGLDATTSDTRAPATFTASASGGSASGTISAIINGVSCTASAVTVYAAAPEQQIRVVVVSSPGHAPIQNATVVLDDQSATTDARGIALFDTPPGDRHTVSAFAADHAYVTVVDTTASDILLPLKHNPNPGLLVGQLKDSDFANLDNRNGTMHISLAGGSIGGNLVDLSLATLLGPSQSMTISLGTGEPYGPFDIPEGIVLGLGVQLFGEDGGGRYGILASPGYRTLWSLGGNAVIGDVLKAIGPVLNDNGGSITEHVPSILSALLPIIGSLDSGVTSNVKVTAGETQMLSIGGAQPSLKMDTAQRLHLSVKTPPLLTYLDDVGAPAAFDGLVVIGGALVPSQGFVPLGLTAGVDQSGPEGTMVPDHITDGVGSAGLPGQLPLRLAPRHGGIEAAPWVYITLGAPLTKLVGGDEGLALSGTISFTPDSLSYNGGQSTTVDLSRQFLPLPAGVSLNETSRLLTVPAVSGATYHQLDIGLENELWSIYFPAGATTVTVPTPPGDVPDRFVGETLPPTVLKSVSLGYGNTTYDDVWQFDGVEADDLTLQMDAFSVRAVKRAQ